MQGLFTIVVSLLVNATLVVSAMNYRTMTCMGRFGPPPLIDTKPLFEIVDMLPTLNQIFGLDVSGLHRSR